MNVEDIVKGYLTANGFDGLANDSECGCGIDDLFACSRYSYDCYPARAFYCYKCKLNSDDGECPYALDYDIIYSCKDFCQPVYKDGVK